MIDDGHMEMAALLRQRDERIAELEADLAHERYMRAQAPGCQCGDADACRLARERDDARAEVERLKAKVKQLQDEVLVNEADFRESERQFASQENRLQEYFRDRNEARKEVERLQGVREDRNEAIREWRKMKRENETLRAAIVQARVANGAKAAAPLAVKVTHLEAEVERLKTASIWVICISYDYGVCAGYFRCEEDAQAWIDTEHARQRQWYADNADMLDGPDHLIITEYYTVELQECR